jgi:CheY-like chemotaxis protein
MKKKILIAEDNVGLNRILQLLLKGRYDTVAAMNGKEAVEIATTQNPDLILMDIVLPVLNGYQAVRIIRQNPKTRLIPVIAVTALSSSEEMKECFQSGCNDYLSKPYTFDQLNPRIRMLLKEYSA